VIGQDVALNGVLKVLEALQCPFLLKSLTYYLLEVLLLQLFPHDSELTTLAQGVAELKTE
jgi:hypothetical protein